MRQDKLGTIIKKDINGKLKGKTESIPNPYVLYRIDGNSKVGKAILRNTSGGSYEDKIHGKIKKITDNGEICYGVKLSKLGEGKIIFRTKDGLYAIYKEKESNFLYLLMYIKYDGIKNKLRKLNKKG